jgi:hypothetical protein
LVDRGVVPALIPSLRSSVAQYSTTTQVPSSLSSIISIQKVDVASISTQAQKQSVSQASQQATRSISALATVPLLAQISMQDVVQSQRQVQEQRARQEPIFDIIVRPAVSQGTRQISQQDLVPFEMLKVTPVSDQKISVVTEPRSTITTKPWEIVTPIVTRTPAAFALPFGSGLRDYSQRKERGAYGFKEVSPTWTPGQMGRALFTGKFTRTVTSRDNLPKRQYRSDLPRLPKMPKVSKRGRKNILKGR